jgi:hypothetical protein
VKQTNALSLTKKEPNTVSVKATTAVDAACNVHAVVTLITMTLTGSKHGRQN